jgi:Mor family transcriptional regulator
MKPVDADELSLDIIGVILLECRAAGLPDEAAEAIERAVRAQFGGQRLFIPKKKRHPSAAQREKIYQAGLTDMSTEEITKKFKIGRTALYELMKRRP